MYWRCVESSKNRNRGLGGDSVAIYRLGVRHLASVFIFYRAKAATAWLALRVHYDAFARAPATYLRAIVWRARRMKLRSRNTLAPLLGRSPMAYKLWIARSEPVRIARGAFSTTIIVVIECRGVTRGLDATLDSLVGQGAVIVTIGGEADPRVTRVDGPKELARLVPKGGAWLLPLRAGDRLSARAIETYAEAATRGARVVYADDDCIGGAGQRCEPHFKPKWNAELFEHHDYLTGASIVHATPDEVNSAVAGKDWARDLVGAAARAGPSPMHLPFVLHHRRERPAPVLPALVTRAPCEPVPLVSVIIPTRNHAALLRVCLTGVRRAAYDPIELIVIDNGSDDAATLELLAEVEVQGAKVLRMPGPFNYSRLNNAAAQHASGEYLCFLNNDVETIDNDWLAIMVRQARRDDIGAVGARLLYPDRTIQHAGVFTGIGGGAGHAHRFERPEEPGYFRRSQLPQLVSAVTAACLVVGRDKFFSVGGFDEIDFPVAFNDVDLCLKLNGRGWQSFYEPRATLIHHESKSRGSDAAKVNKLRFAGELAALKRKWKTDCRTDPYHHPHLSRFSEKFLIAV